MTSSERMVGLRVRHLIFSMAGIRLRQERFNSMPGGGEGLNLINAERRADVIGIWVSYEIAQCPSCTKTILTDFHLRQIPLTRSRFWDDIESPIRDSDIEVIHHVH